jgi:hypothetical protein
MHTTNNSCAMELLLVKRPSGCKKRGEQIMSQQEYRFVTEMILGLSTASILTSSTPSMLLAGWSRSIVEGTYLLCCCV